MKFKFRADPENAKYFVMFAIFLLYLIALAVLNMSTLSQTGKFYGINPIRAFTPEFLPATISFYILAVGGIIFSVKSYFFDREKGFGFETGKVDKGGYSRWSKDYEMKKKLKEINLLDPVYANAGVPLLYDKKKPKAYVDNGESHSLIVGTTGSGKTWRFVQTLIKILAKKGESMILTDPKGELYQENASLLKEKGYNIILLNLRDPEKGNAWNPLMLPYKLYKNGSDKANELLNDLARNLLYDEKNKDDPFWEATSADYFTGLALGLFEDAKEEEINLNSISYMTSVGEEKYGSSTYIKSYFEGKDPSKPAYINAASTINAPSDTKASILSVFRQKIKIFAITEHLSEMLSYSDFDVQDIGRKKTAVFIIIQDEKKTYHALATVFVKQCYETLIDVAQENGGKLPIRTNFILDEFANMPPLRDATTMITAARSRQIRFNLIIQNFAQLNKVYGKEEAETLKGNCSNLIYMLSKELQALEEISKLCGERKHIEKDGKEVGKPLITISELQRLKEGDTIIIKDRAYPFKTKFKGTWELNFGEEKSIPPSYPERTKKPISLFDVREFVKEKKRDSLFNMLNENPYGGNNPNPFGGPQMMPPHNDMFGGQPMPPHPGMPSMPGMPGMNPFGAPPNIPNGNMPNGGDNFNIDDLIKKIDAKILELEKEEANEASKNNTTPSTTSNPSIVEAETKPVVEETKSPVTPAIDETEEVVKINPDIDKIINSRPEDENTDDQFFDDFFNDEE